MTNSGESGIGGDDAEPESIGPALTQLISFCHLKIWAQYFPREVRNPVFLKKYIYIIRSGNYSKV